MPPSNLADFLPLPTAELHILLALRDSDLHGYAMMQQIERETDGRVRLGPATLYGAIKRLRTQGLIVESMRRREPQGDDERRRYYRLHALGRRVLAAELQRLANLVQIGVAAGLIKPHPAM